MPPTGHTAEETAIFRKTIIDFYELWPKLQHAHDTTYKILMAFGIVGGIVGLGTMIQNRYMRVTSFLYHKILMAANLIFCINWVVLHLIDTRLHVSVPREQFVFSSRSAAFYSGVVQRAITSASGYVWMYMTLFIALDRCIALAIPKVYKTFSTKACCYSVVCISVLLSICLHSWSPWIERQVIILKVNDSQTNQILQYYQWMDVKEQIPETLRKAKDLINGAIRISFPFLLTIFTGVAIGFYIRRRDSRRERRSAQFRRQETYLFLLMVTVVILAFIQVIPRESKRVVELMYPKHDIEKILRNPGSVPFERGLFLLKIYLYGHKVLGLVTNICTAIDRSLVFYLYLLLNPMFRRATLQVEYCTETRMLQPLVSTDDKDDEQRELTLLFSPQLAENFNAVFNMTQSFCRGFLAMKGPGSDEPHAGPSETPANTTNLSKIARKSSKGRLLAKQSK